MFDARYFTYATIAALLVISPGATMTVVMETAIESGRTAALSTVLGVNIGNSTLALSSALGMAVILARWPWALHVVKVAGACYLTWLGARAIWRAAAVGQAPRTKPSLPAAGASSPRARRSSFVVRGVVTNLLNPPVILFYLTVLPQFISHEDPFLWRFLVLAATHISMSVAWLAIYAISIGTLSERMARPVVQRCLAGVTGAVLIGFGVRLLLA